MSSTSNIQNLLVNVFRPTVAYDPSTGYVPKVNLCNVDSISAKSLSVTTFGLGDSNGNIFIGSNAGGTSSNTNNTVLGFAAGSGMANTTSSVYIGNVAGIGAQGASNVIGIGKEARGAGTSNIYIGSTTGSSNASSANNILIGHGIDYSNQVISNTLQIGRPGSLVIQGNLANKQVGINTAPAYGLDVCGDFSFHNSNGSFTYALDSSGDTQIDFRSSNVGKKAVLNVVGDVYGQSFYGAFSGSITTPSVTMGSGSITAPSYSFSNDTSTGFYYSFAPTFLGVTVRGCNSMTVNTTGVGIGKTATTQLDVSGTTTSSNLIIPGYARNAATPTTWDISGGNMYLQSNLKLQTITATGDISATGTIYGSFVSTGLTTSNIYVPGFIRNTAVGFNLDISGGNISNSGTITSSNIRVGSGTVSTPSYAFSTDASLGLYRVGANQLGFATAGVNRMTISNGNVGIGTTAPAYTLDISAVSDPGVVIRHSTTPATIRLLGGGVADGAGTGMSIFHTSNDQGIFNSNANPFSIWTSNARRLTILSNGRVGLGTTAPAAVLDVSAANDPGIIVRAPGTQAGITLLGYGTTNGLNVYNRDVDQGLFTNNALPLVFWTNSNIRMTISGERVGIGTTAPTQRLDVNGTIRGSSNIVAVATTSNWITPTAFTDTSLTIVYTPKQSGTVTLIVNANATMYTGSGSGLDGVVLQIRNNATVLTDYYFNVSNDIVNGRGNNSYSGGRWATTTVTAATPINIRVTRVGDDVPSVRDGYLSIYELSTT